MTDLYEKYGDAAERMLHFVETRSTDQASDIMRVPVENYLDEDRFKREMDRIFMRLPLMLALTIELPEVNDYKAMQVLGKPVIITRGTSTEGILDDSLALLVPPGDASALRTALVRLWNDSALRVALSENGKRYAVSLGNHERLLTDLRSVIQREYALSESSRLRPL